MEKFLSVIDCDLLHYVGELREKRFIRALSARYLTEKDLHFLSIPQKTSLEYFSGFLSALSINAHKIISSFNISDSLVFYRILSEFAARRSAHNLEF